MFTVRTQVVGVLVGLILSSGLVLAAESVLTGVFQGSGRQCYGKLVVRATTLAWSTPFASCGQTAFEVIKNKPNATKPEIVFLLKGSKQCGFSVVTLDWDPAFPNFWNATGYRSLADYEMKSDDKLRCNLEKLEK